MSGWFNSACIEGDLCGLFVCGLEQFTAGISIAGSDSKDIDHTAGCTNTMAKTTDLNQSAQTRPWLI